jgi:hypothetical protein
MRYEHCGWPSKNHMMSNDGRPVHAPRRRLLAAVYAIALIVIVVPSSSGQKPAPRAMGAFIAIRSTPPSPCR